MGVDVGQLEAISDGRASIRMLARILEDRPEELFDAIDYVVPKIPRVREFIGVESWKWIDFLLDGKNGVFVLAAESIKEIFDALEKLRQKNFESGKNVDKIRKS